MKSTTIAELHAKTTIMSEVLKKAREYVDLNIDHFGFYMKEVKKGDTTEEVRFPEIRDSFRGDMMIIEAEALSFSVAAELVVQLNEIVSKNPQSAFWITVAPRTRTPYRVLKTPKWLVTVHMSF